jgi:hypothetical protein
MAVTNLKLTTRPLSFETTNHTLDYKRPARKRTSQVAINENDTEIRILPDNAYRIHPATRKAAIDTKADRLLDIQIRTGDGRAIGELRPISYLVSCGIISFTSDSFFLSTFASILGTEVLYSRIHDQSYHTTPSRHIVTPQLFSLAPAIIGSTWLSFPCTVRPPHLRNV